MKILVTGGTSFIGAYVVLELLSHGHVLTVLARQPEKVRGFAPLKNLTMVKGLIEDEPLIARLLHGQDAVVYLAHAHGEGAAGKLVADVLPAAKFLEAAGRAGVRKFIFTSSTAALGELSKVMHEDRNCVPNAWWCASKAAIEDFVLAASYETGMLCNIIRPSLTFGRPACAGAPTEGVSKYRDIVALARSGQPIILRRDDGTQMIFAGDLAKVYSALLAADVNRQIYHGVVSERTTWRQYAEKVIALTGSRSEIVIDEQQPPAFDCVYAWDGIRRDFGLEFKPWPALEEHVRFILAAAPAGLA